MKDLVGKVAVITGAGSGMGRAMVRKAASEGMHVLAGDIDEAGLAETVGGLENAQLMLTDVTSPDANEALANAALERFGGIHLVHLNAGVLTGGFTWENTVRRWRWVLDVTWGDPRVRTSFRMLDKGEDGHVTLRFGGRAHRWGAAGPLLHLEVRGGGHCRVAPSGARHHRRTHRGVVSVPRSGGHRHLPGRAQPPRHL